MTDAMEILSALLERVARDHDRTDVNIKAITSGGANYTSSLYQATLSSPLQPDIKLFAKVAMLGEKMRAAMNADALYRKERYFYNKLLRVYTELQEKHNVPEQYRVKFPKFYALNENHGEETVVLEDLVANGYGTYSRFKSLDWLHASRSVETLAHFHALSFAYQKESPKEFEDAAQEFKFCLIADDTGEASETVGKMMQGALQVLDKEDQGRIAKFLTDGDMRVKFKGYNSPISRTVIIHGDYRPSNLLFRKKDENLEVMPVDYQTLTAGCPVTDLVYLICMGTDEEFRKEHYQKLVELYYTSLGESLKRLGISIEEVYDRKTFDDELKEMLPYGLILGVIILPIVTVEADAAPKMEGDAKIDSIVVEPNELFASRFRGLVKDCIQWGVL